MRKLILCFLALFLCLPIYAQPHQKLAKTALPLSKVERISLPKVNNKLLKAKELKEREKTKARAIQFAESIEVNINPQTHGTWENLKKGKAVWRLQVHSANALSLNLGFSQFFLPKNAEFFIYTPNYETILGPFTASDNDLHKQLWTPIIEGDEVVLELQIARESLSELALELGTVNHDFMGFGQKLLSGSCNLDVLCGAADGFPRVDDYRDIIRSAGAYSIGGAFACSGALINNARNDCTPYFLTADHCGVRNNNAASVVVYWNYQNSVCRQPFSPESGAPGDGSLTDFNSGSILKATYGPTDFTLIELDDPVSETAQPYFAGWNKSADVPTAAIGIHHPGVEEKRISFENDQLTLGSFGGAVPETHLRVNDWDTGTTEGGSSGSPLFNPEKQIVGQLSGGLAACGNDEYDEYGWIHKSWEGGGSPATRLKDWLDPDDIIVAGIEGKDCSYGLSLTQNFVEVCNQNLDKFSFELTITDNFVGNVGFFTGDVPEGLIIEYTTNPVPTGGTTTVTLSNLSALTTGSYTIDFFGSDGFDTGSSTFTLSIVEDLPATPSLMSPPNAEENVTTNPTYDWEMIENATYSLQVSLTEDFGNLVIDSDNLEDASFSGFTLEPVTTYYWRTKANNICGEGEWSETFRFTTADIRCTLPQSSDVPVNIPDFPAGTIVSTLEIDQLGTISDIDVMDLRGTHTFLGDLEFVLISPAGTEVVLISGQCGSVANFDVNFNDDAAALPPCPYADGNTYRPAESLSAFNGESPSGVWTLRVTDDFNGDGGSLENWGLQICVAPAFELLAAESMTVCVNEPFDIPIRLGDAYDDNGVNLNISGLPDGANATYSENPAAPGSEVTATVDNIAEIGIYSLTISASDGMHNSFTQVELIVVPPVAASPSPNLPANESEIESLNATMNWSILGGITGYHIEIATDADFNNIVISEVIPTVDYISPELEGNTTYYWRVSGVNACGNGDSSETFSFSTPRISCSSGEANEELEINPVEPSEVVSTIEIAASNIISDVNVLDITGVHTYLGDLVFTLVSPAGTEVLLVAGECADTQNFNVSFDDDAMDDIFCPLNGGNTHRPEGNLSDFIGENSQGTWSLRVEDTGFFDGGALQSWRLQICTEPDFSLTSLPENIETCPNETATFSLTVGADFDSNVSLTAEDAPMGAVVNFSEPTTSPGATVDVTVDGLTTEGTYTIVLSATDGTETSNIEVNISVLGNVTGVTLLAGPINGITLATLSTTLQWTALEGIDSYELQIATEADFSNVVLFETISGTTFFNTPLMDGNTTYHWRVRGTNICGAGEWSDAFRFITPNLVCTVNQAADLPLTIGDGEPATYTSTINVTEQGIIKDVNISLAGLHTFVGDLTFTLISPTGTELILIEAACGDNENFNITFDDGATLPAPCPYDDGEAYLPANALSIFNNEQSFGTWTLQVTDGAEADGGLLESWHLDLCVEPQEILLPVADFTVGIDEFDVFVSDKSENAESWFWDFGDETTFEGQNPPIHTYAAAGEYTICLTVTNTAGENTICQTVQIIDTSIDPILANNLIRFYPNPTKDLIHIDFDTSVQMAVTMEIFGVNGQQISQGQLSSSETATTATVDLSNFATGVYMVRLTSSDWTVTKKVVKE